MAQVRFEQLTGDEKLPELIDMVAKLQKQVEWLMNGKISSDNVREIGSWQVREDALISDETTYPRIVLDPKGKLLGFYTSPDQYMEIGALEGTQEVPFIKFVDTVTGKQALIYLGSELFIQGSGGTRVGATGSDTFINGNTTFIPGILRVDLDNFIDTDNGQSLRTQLNAKANGSATSKTVYVASASGGTATTPLTITNGIVTS